MGPDAAVVPEPLRGLSAGDDRSLEARLADQYGVTTSATGAVFITVAMALVESPGYEPHHATPAGLDATVGWFDRS